MRRYITTAIDYPNAPPHMGHVLEKVLADVIARWWRLSGDDVRFQIGTDEHGVKIQQTADREGVTPRELVDRNVPLFRSLYDRLSISYDRFLRTTDQVVHWPTVQELWRRLQKSGVLEKRTYTGLYCSGCERFTTRKDLIDGKCPDHQKVPEEVREENWFFLLKREGEWLRDLLACEDGYRIIPASRSHETLSLIDHGLEDVSFSRPKSSLSWGIPVPGDPEQTMYVWCDALTNYISGLGYFTDHEEKEWWEDADVTHVIGKDIARFHALIWPAMLKHVGLLVPPPHRLLIHGFITSEGQKMSKSIGNVVDPVEVIEKYGVDALRMYLCGEVAIGDDGDFSWQRMHDRYTNHYAKDLGNLLNRVLVLLAKDDGKIDFVSDLEAKGGERRFTKLGSLKSDDGIRDVWVEYEEAMSAFDFRKAVHIIWMSFVGGPTQISQNQYYFGGGNGLMQTFKPWEEKRDIVRLQKLMFVAEMLRHAALMLWPFMPQKAYEISRQLGVTYVERMHPDNKKFVVTEHMKFWGSDKDWRRIGEPEILFPKVD